MSEPVIPEPPSFESQYCSYGDCGYVECEKSFLLAKLGAAEAKVAKQVATIERLIMTIENHFGCKIHTSTSDPDRQYCQCGWKENSPIHTLALSKQEPE